MVGALFSHVIAELSLKRIGVKPSEIGWFWLIEILLSIVIIKYIENIIEAIVHLATGTWSPGQTLEGITGILAIAGAIMVGLILFLIYSGKIKVKDSNSNHMKFFEITSLKDLKKESLLDGLKKEIIIVCGPSPNFVIAFMECVWRSKELIFIEKLNILSQEFKIPSDIDDSEKSKKKVTKGEFPPVSERSGAKLIIDDPFTNQCSRLLSYVNETFKPEYPNVLDFRITKEPIHKSVVLIVSYDSNKQNRFTELYTEPFIPMGMHHQHIAYKFRSDPKPKKSNEIKQDDLFDLEYSNFLKWWKSAATNG
ncbi:hypothetical protein [Candidatus Nitrosocosmicus arcticus]|uniref:Uncharacterized protein n=1 Tax=Candidatus Nitrosocosmicus arcticus TaxID=2035267 RepID=A0A557SWZ5_9ARCH|nr:hypothetical protein [Candidatus Nitrosocosmicus arcticus]TVP41129.1 hypothetical protein NARC_40091 [Candidatus Nitrosocosmicus arcticus]